MALGDATHEGTCQLKNTVIIRDATVANGKVGKSKLCSDTISWPARQGSKCFFFTIERTSSKYGAGPDLNATLPL